MKLLKTLSQSIRKDQFSASSVEDSEEAFKNSPDDARLAWKKIFDDVVEKEQKVSSHLIRDFDEIKEMDDSPRDLERRKEKYDSYLKLAEFIQQIDNTYKPSVDQV